MFGAIVAFALVDVALAINPVIACVAFSRVLAHTNASTRSPTSLQFLLGDVLAVGGLQGDGGAVEFDDKLGIRVGSRRHGVDCAAPLDSMPMIRVDGLA